IWAPFHPQGSSGACPYLGVGPRSWLIVALARADSKVIQLIVRVSRPVGSPHHDAVNRFLTMAWRRQAQFGTLLHLGIFGVAQSKPHYARARRSSGLHGPPWSRKP